MTHTLNGIYPGRSIPIPGERPTIEADPFPEPHCAFCGQRVLLVGPNARVDRQLVHDGFTGALDAYLVPRTAPGAGVVYTHRVCGLPERRR